MRSIGEMARSSGLSISALRFYDAAGVLVPAWVDPVSGYRWYSPGQLEESRLLVRLRRADMPLADIRLVLAGWSSQDTDLVRKLLQAHLRRLELGLSDARSEFSTIRSLLERRENPVTLPATANLRLTISASALAAALDAVRFAASTDPELPMLGGVLFDIESDSLRVVATDRYRMAVARTATTGHRGPRVQVIVPSPLADAMRALLSDETSVRLTVDGDRVALEAAGRLAAGERVGHDFPDYRRLIRRPSGHGVLVDVPAFRKSVKTGAVRAGVVRAQDGVSCDLSVLKVTADGMVTVCGDGDEDQNQVAVNRQFLLHALSAGDQHQLVLEFGAPTAPLTIRRTDTEDTFSMLMPVRLEN